MKLINYKKLLTGFAAGLLLYAQTGFSAAQAAVPPDAPKDVKYILGFYYGNGENILIRENNGRLELLYRFSRDDKAFEGANIYPLAKEHFDSYTMIEAGPMSSAEANVRFERDQDGYGIACRVGGHTYSRYFLGQGTGERAKAFRFPALTEEQWTQLRSEADKAVMPAALAAGKQARLTDAAAIAGVKINSVYAGADNCFGVPLYAGTKLYVSEEVAAALAKAQKQLEQQGYGLMLWDAYRPWSISKLAHAALPENSKGMLDDPELKGSAHNTGTAVDVTLYELATGAELEMISGFDEPSMRQYASYAGGTSRQRYLRQLLRNAMEDSGFTGIEMEWWHFEYQPKEQWAHLNTAIQ